jgi:hypothetical protein
MKSIISVFTILCLLLINSCKSDSGPTSAGGLGGTGGGGGGGGAVTVSITQQTGTQGIIFFGSPSSAVVLTSYTASVPALQFTQNYTVTTGAVLPANVPQKIDEFTGVLSGQKWVFTFQGNVGSATGTAFNITSNYTVP